MCEMTDLKSATIHILIRNMPMDTMDIMFWEDIAAYHTKWRSALKEHLKTGEDKLMTAVVDTRACRKEGSDSIRPETKHRCDFCNKDCHSRIGLFSHKRHCYSLASKKIKNKNIRMYLSPMVISDRRRPLSSVLMEKGRKEALDCTMFA